MPVVPEQLGLSGNEHYSSRDVSLREVREKLEKVWEYKTLVPQLDLNWDIIFYEVIVHIRDSWARCLLFPAIPYEPSLDLLRQGTLHP